MYGSLDAAQRWGEHYAQVLEARGCSRGVASPCHFFHKGLQTYILVHDDDFFTVDRREGRKHALSLLRSAYELSKVGPRVVTVKDSEFLGQNTDSATMVNRVRSRPAACFPRLEGFGIDRW